MKLLLPAALGTFLLGLGLNLVMSEAAPVSIWSMMGFIFMSPMFEEVLFRWLLYRHVCIRFIKKPRAALWTASALFALWHLPSGLISVVYALPMGLLFCLVYRAYGRLDASYLLHMAANAGSVARAYITWEKPVAVGVGGVFLCIGAILVVDEFLSAKKLSSDFHVGS